MVLRALAVKVVVTRDKGFSIQIKGHFIGR